MATSTEQCAPRSDINERTRKISNVLSNALSEILEDLRPMTHEDANRLKALWENELNYALGTYQYGRWIEGIKQNQIK